MKTQLTFFHFLIILILLLSACGGPTTQTPPAVADILFTAERTDLQPGECTTLHWQVQGGFGVRLDDQPVEQTGQTEVCPVEPRTYTLAVDLGTHMETREVRITVGSGAGSSGQPTEAAPTLSEVNPAPATRGTPVSEPGVWLRLGGPAGGLGYDIRYSFTDPNLWYVTDNYAGVHISTDNGITWQPSNTGIPPQAGSSGDWRPIFSLTVDQNNPQIIWAGTDGTGNIYKSTDGGKTWQEKNNGLPTKYPGLTFRGFTIDPTSSGIVYAMAETTDISNGEGYGLAKGGMVFRTTNGGESWQTIWDGGTPSSLARYLWIDPRDTKVLYVSTGIFDRTAIGEHDPEVDPGSYDGGLGILKSTDGGQTWRYLNQANGLNNLYVGSLYMHPQIPDILLAGTGHMTPTSVLAYRQANGIAPTAGVYRTEDGGEHWTHVLVAAADKSESFSAVEFCPTDPNVAYAGSELSVYRSEDAGITWELVSGASQPWGPVGIEAGWPIDLQCDPRDPNRLFANNYNGGNFLSEDGGRTWQGASDGYTGAQIRSVAVDPVNSDRIYAAGRSGLWRSVDGGSTWNGLWFPPADNPLGGLEWDAIVIDLARADHALAGRNGIFESFDSGASWEYRISTEDLTGNGASPFSMLVFAPSDSSMVYGGMTIDSCSMRHERSMCDLSDGGVAISRDGGTTWEAAEDDLVAHKAVLDLAVDQSNAQIVYAVTASGLVKTTDGGLHWTQLTGFPSDAPTRAVAVDPTNAQHLLLGFGGAGIYVSEDGGQTWRSGSVGWEPNGSIHDILFDPVNSQVVYASDYFSGVYRSADGGYTWSKINQGLDVRAVMGLSISSDGKYLSAASDGGGVYRMATP